MFTVIITEKGGEQRRVEFDKPEVTIGRVQGNDIILPKGNVSKRHSRIVVKDGKFIIVDLKSTNGTYVNGRKISSPLVLKDSDKIYIGDFILTVEEGPGFHALAGSGASLAANPAPLGGGASTLSPGYLDAPGPAPLPVPVPPPPPPPHTVAMPPLRKTAGARGPAPRDVPDDEGFSGDDLDDVIVPGPPRTVPAPPPLAPVGRHEGSQSGPLPRPAPATRASTLGARAEQAAPMGPASSAGTVPVRRDASARPPRLPSQPPVTAERPARARVVTPDADDSARSLAIRREVVERVAAELGLADVPPEGLGDEDLRQRAEQAVADLVEQLDGEGALHGALDPDVIIREALAELLGAGPLEDLLTDDQIGDVLVNRHDVVLVDRGGRLVASDRAFSTDGALRQAIERLLAASGVRLDPGAYLVDARLRDGTRLTAALPPVAVRGACVTLRRARRGYLSVDDLVRGGALSAKMAEFLGLAVQARRNVLVCGGPGAGKTELASALGGLLPASERVVAVEEVAELALAHDGWLALEARPARADGRDGVTLLEALQAALRMRPERLVVGELRGAETFEALAAISAAHPAALATVAGDGARPALARVEALARLGAGGAAQSAVRTLVAQAIELVVHVALYGDGRRRVASIAEVTGIEPDGVATRELFRFEAEGGDVASGRFVGAGIRPRFVEALEARGQPVDPAIFR